LVEQLANAHAALSDYARAKEVLEYGLANDPEHFWFSYNLARVHAATGDADNAVAYLEKAALVHKKTDPRRRFRVSSPPPDPAKDAVFARLKETDRFKKAAKGLK
ncbi:MAG TPA: tetratricopeptide repeat protein, partial [Pyrinomonadaceae bacterium]|nr:tetratricopeptide repeat protein [Pyrinomonadaceae bacterium]